MVRFEEFFCGQLRDQHERVDLFVRSKADEFRRRLVDYERKANRLIGDGDDLRETMRGRRGDRLARLETRIMRFVPIPAFCFGCCGCADVVNKEEYTDESE